MSFHDELLGHIRARRYSAALGQVRELALEVAAGKSNAPIVERLIEAARAALLIAHPVSVIEQVLARSRALNVDSSLFNCLLLVVHGRERVTTLDVSPRHVAADGTTRSIVGTIEEPIVRHDPAELDSKLARAFTDLLPSIDLQRSRVPTEEGRRIARALFGSDAVAESKLTDFLSKQYGVPAINLKDFDIGAEIIRLVPKDVALRYLVIPINVAGPSLIIAMCDPSNIYAVDDLKFLTGKNIEAVVASEPSIRMAIARYYGAGGGDTVSGSELYAAVHLVTFAEAFDQLTEALSRSPGWSALAQRPFTFIGRWLVQEGAKAQLKAEWTIRRVE